MLYKPKEPARLLGILALTVWLLTACSSSNRGTEATPTNRNPEASPTQRGTATAPATRGTAATPTISITPIINYDFKPFISNEGGFSVLMPGAPNQKKQSVITTAGLLDLYLFTVELENDTTAYLATYVDYPENVVKTSNSDEVLSNVRDGQLDSQKGRLLSERFVAIGQYPGRELEIETASNYVRGRIYLVGTRLYQVLAVYPLDQRPADISRRFLDSFKLSN